MSSAFAISSILEKISSRDKDFRYMATMDLYNELMKDTFKVEPEGERKLCVVVLKQLEDSNGDVQSLAVKCLVPLLRKAHESNVEDVIEQLISQIFVKTEQRDIFSLAFKTAIAELAGKEEAASIIKRLTPRVIGGLQQRDNIEVRHDCLDILEDLLRRFGSALGNEHENVQNTLLSQLSSDDKTTRKKAISCTGSLALVISESLFASLIGSLLGSLERAPSPAVKLTYVQTLTAISRVVSHRLGKYLDKMLPVLLAQCEDLGVDQSDDLHEACMMCLISIMQRSPKQLALFLDQLIQRSLAFAKHDPNVADTDDGLDNDLDEMDTNEFEADEDEEEYDYGDDSDESDKVRRAGCRGLGALAQALRPLAILSGNHQWESLLASYASTVLPALVNRFSEREEHVRLEVFATYVTVLKEIQMCIDKAAVNITDLARFGLTETELTRLVRAIARELSGKSAKTRSAVFSVLRELARLPLDLTPFLSTIVPHIVNALKDKSASNNMVKLEALTALRLLLASQTIDSFGPYIESTLPPLLEAIKDSYYKVAVEALRVTGELIRIMRPATAVVQGTYFVNHQQFVNPLYDAIMARFRNLEQDLELKEWAITCMALLLAHFGEALSGHLSSCLTLLLERMKIENTRLPNTKAWIILLEAPLPMPTHIVAPLANELTSYLRQSSRALRVTAFQALNVLLSKYGEHVPAAVFEAMLSQSAPSLSDADLLVAHLALTLCAAVIRLSPEGRASVPQVILPKLLDLAQSPLLQGAALQSLIHLFGVSVTTSDNGLTADSLLRSLMSVVQRDPQVKSLSKQAYSTLARCVAEMCVHLDSNKQRSVIFELLSVLEQSTASGPVRTLALLSLGEIGRLVDLSGHPTVETAILSYFESPDEELRTVASVAYGNMSVGKLSTYLPDLLNRIKTRPQNKYPLLVALREVIARPASGDHGQTLQPFAAEVVAMLSEDSEHEEEPIRRVVSDCLARLCLIATDVTFTALEQLLRSSNPVARSTALHAFRSVLYESHSSLDSELNRVLPFLLSYIQDPNLPVRRSALLFLNACAHNRSTLIRHHLSTTLPLLFAETVKKPELIREVDLGPFKHTVDDGLETRKTAFECLSTLVDNCLDSLPGNYVVEQLNAGLSDDYDIKLLSHAMLAKLSRFSGEAVAAELDRLLPTLRAAVSKDVKENAVRQEADQHDELIRTTLFTLASVSLIPEAESSISLTDILNGLRNGPLKEKWETAVAEAKRLPVVGSQVMDDSSMDLV